MYQEVPETRCRRLMEKRDRGALMCQGVPETRSLRLQTDCRA